MKRLPPTVTNAEILAQLTRAAGSVGASYIEANEPIGRKDFFMKMRICKRESKESHFWLRLADCIPEDEDERALLVDEAYQLLEIFSSIVSRTSSLAWMRRVKIVP